jgi:hypothetical protein
MSRILMQSPSRPLPVASEPRATHVVPRQCVLGAGPCTLSLTKANPPVVLRWGRWVGSRLQYLA